MSLKFIRQLIEILADSRFSTFEHHFMEIPFSPKIVEKISVMTFSISVSKWTRQDLCELALHFFLLQNVYYWQKVSLFSVKEKTDAVNHFVN
jgi:hypothetical protein